MGMNCKGTKSHLGIFQYFHVVWEMIVFKWHFEGNRHNSLMGEISGMISEQNTVTE